LSRLRT